jgi:hypothetical protein
VCHVLVGAAKQQDTAVAWRSGDVSETRAIEVGLVRIGLDAWDDRASCARSSVTPGELFPVRRANG